MIAGFHFDEATHVYSRPGGLVLPGATRCIDHSGLTSYEMVKADILERRGDLGKAVHSATHFDDEGDLDDRYVSDEVRGYLDSWRTWRAHTGFVPIVIEHQQIAEIHSMPYGMKLDRFGKVRKVPAIVEIKISSSIQDWHGVQLAGYAAGYTGHTDALTALGRFMLRERYVIKLDPKGRMPRMKKFDERRDFDVFAAALAITTWKMQHGKKIVTE